MTKTRSPVREALAQCRPELLAAAFFSLFLNLLMLVVPIYIMQIFTRVLVSGSRETLVVLTVAAVAAMIIYGLLTLQRGNLLTRMSSKVDTLLAERVHGALIARSVRTAETRSAQALRDLAQVRNLLAGQELQSLFDVPWTPIFLVVIFLLHPVLGIVSLVGALVLLALALVNDRLTRKPLMAAGMAAIKANNNASANVRNAEVVEGMGMRAAVIERWQRYNTEVLDQQTQAADIGGLLAALSRVARMIVQIGIFGAGAWLVMAHDLTSGAMMAATFLMANALRPVESAIRTWKQLLAAREAYQRLERLLADVPEPGSGMPLPRPAGRLSVEQIVFTPPKGERPVLRGVSFVVEPGEMLGIVGPSAAGKSTLAKIIVGVWRPSSGAVRLDEADVAGWDPIDLGQHVGYLPQDVELFEGTVRENIARMTDAPPEAVIAAAQKAGVHEMILRLPEGYETQIGEGGSVLSGGQRQRIGLARALFGDPRLVVLDEPNANLDTEGERALAQALAEVRREGATVVVIAHRPSLLAVADRILVLRDGRIEMQGSRDAILAKIAPKFAGPRSRPTELPARSVPPAVATG
ncbi:MAG: type I secretion system permease/ATPase [Rhodospirillaceae bacterium]|nr:type I secretion system permease/ATPase [Rhodospirillaceae bacterium]